MGPLDATPLCTKIKGKAVLLTQMVDVGCQMDGPGFVFFRIRSKEGFLDSPLRF